VDDVVEQLSRVTVETPATPGEEVAGAGDGGEDGEKVRLDRDGVTSAERVAPDDGRVRSDSERVTPAERVRSDSERVGSEGKGSRRRRYRSRRAAKQRTVVKVLHCDIIGNEFWQQHPSVLAGNVKDK